MPSTESKPLTPGQVAALFSVSVTTVGKWADSGKLRAFKTPGGQRRFRTEDVEAALAVEASEEAATA